MMIKGTAVSPGTGIGQALWYAPKSCARREKATESAEPVGLAAYRFAAQRAAAEISRLAAALSERMGAEEADILRVQLFFLRDPLWDREVEGLIGAGRLPHEAVAAAAGKFAAAFAASGDPALRERAVDIRDVAARIESILCGQNSVEGQNGIIGDSGLSGDPDHVFYEAVLLAEEIYPSLAAAMDPARVRGLVTGSGGYASHAAIIARALGIPAVMGVAGVLHDIEQGTLLVVDGDRGEVLVSPDAEMLCGYQRKTARRQEGEIICAREEIAGVKGVGEEAAGYSPVCTGDGTPITIAANAGTLTEAKMARSAGAAGIGLYRTEYAYLERDRWPTEDELYEEYAAVAGLWPDGEVVFRTFDLGGDKLPEYITLPREENPMLGLRGIRLARQFPEHFVTQLKALLRASVHGRVKIMAPMVTVPDECRWVRALLQEAAQLTGSRNVPPFGLMVEVPATAITLDLFADLADFFSLGTNDLAQYTLAVDRLQTTTGQHFFYPGLLRLLQIAVTGAGEAGKPISICGEMAGHERAAPLLLGLGLRSLSVGVDRLQAIRGVIGKLTVAGCQKTAQKAGQLATSEEVDELLDAKIGQLLDAKS